MDNKYITFDTSKRAVATYILFNKPIQGQSLDELCNSNCLKERFCIYHQKEIAKSILNVELAKKNNDNGIFAVDILFSKKTLFFGLSPAKQNKNFIFIPLLNFEDLTSFASKDKPSPNLVLLKYKFDNF